MREQWSTGRNGVRTSANNAVILGCGYVGRQVAQDWLSKGLNVTVTTTTAAKVSELVAIHAGNRHPKAVVIHGDDATALTSLLAGQDTVLVSVASQGKRTYQDTYLATAQTLAQVLPQTSVTQVIYTGSFGVYGNHGDIGLRKKRRSPLPPLIAKLWPMLNSVC